MSKQNLKYLLFKECELFLNERSNTLTKMISGIQNSLQSETKSSAGDKHETGRAMLQLEREKVGKQFSAIQKQQLLLSKTNINEVSSVARLGSLIDTNQGIYFLAISRGKVILKGKPYYIVAPHSPIGKFLLGKKIANEFIFNDKYFIINKIY